MTALQRLTIYAAVRRRMLDWYGPFKSYGRCLYWVHAGLATLMNDYGIQCWPMAGSAEWYWDGNRFAFEWGGSPSEIQFIGKGSDELKPLPEMHCWIYTGQKEIVDFSLCEFGQVIQNLTGEDWNVTLPPYIWRTAGALPAGTIYIPNREATALAVAHMMGQHETT